MLWPHLVAILVYSIVLLLYVSKVGVFGSAANVVHWCTN